MRQARYRVFFLACTDVLLMSVIFSLTTVLYFHSGYGSYNPAFYWNLAPVLLIYVLSNGLIRLYHGNFFYPGSIMQPQEELRRLVFSISLTYLLLFAYLLLVRENSYSRFVLLVTWFLNCLLAIPCRGILRMILKKAHIAQIPVLIAGAGKSGIRLAEFLKDDEHFGFEVVGFLDDIVTETPDGCPPVLGKLENVREIARENHVDYLICCLPLPAVSANFREWLRFMKHISVIPTNKVLPASWAYSTSIGGFSGIEIRNQLLLPGPRITKTVFEIIVSVLGIILLLPLLLLLALLVKITSRGPAVYGAKRIGLNGREITVWKFRTMRQDAEEYLKKMLESDPVLADEWKKNFKLENDPRITPFGRFLRKTSLDELPQLFNVITGEMAMIGPRPIVKAEISYYGKDYDVFSRVKPGITGLWQVSGRSNTTYEQRVSYDLSYIMNWSIWLDAYILIRTIFVVLRCKGAK